MRGAARSLAGGDVDQMMTLNEASASCGLTVNTLRALLNRQRLAGRKRGRDWFVSARDLHDYLASRDARGRRPRVVHAEWPR